MEGKEILRVAICEDSEMEQKRLLKIIEMGEYPAEPTVFGSGEAFLQEYHTGQFDVIFMDIYMNGMSGVDTVRSIREIDANVIIAFTTSSTEFALEGYRLDVFKYLEKPVQAKDVYEVLAFTQMKQANRPKIKFKSGRQECSVALSDILYAEQKGHYVTFYLTDRTSVRTADKLDCMQAQLPEPDFFRCHKSYLVNLAHVKTIDPELSAFVMENGDCVYIRRESLAASKRAFEDFSGKH